jgi:hypothetical protein
MQHIVLQRLGNAESRAIQTAAMLANDVKVVNADVDSIQDHRSLLKMGAIPVGSVQFVRRAMELADIVEPENLTYPPGCERYMKRKYVRSTVGRALDMAGRRFLKSCGTKVFTGFVLDSDCGPMGLSNHDQHQYDTLCGLTSDEPVWVSEPVHWISEYRYYVMDSRIIGHARYDQTEAHHVPEPDIDVVNQCIVDLGIEHPYALDMGVLLSGETALVEVNDAWAIGLYGGALTPYEYLRFLTKRWEDLGKSVV